MPRNNPVITLPDGSKREFDNPISVLGVAEDIGPGLAKATLAGLGEAFAQRCRLVDLGRWLDEQQGLPVDSDNGRLS